MRTETAPASRHRDYEGASAVIPQLSRRSFLRGTAIGGATVAVAGTAGLSYRVFASAQYSRIYGQGSGSRAVAH